MNDLSRDYFPNLKRRMAEAGISGNRLAKALGHSGAGAVSRYLNGKQAARAGTIQKFEKAFQGLLAAGQDDRVTKTKVLAERAAFEKQARKIIQPVLDAPLEALGRAYAAYPSPDTPPEEIGPQRGAEEPTGAFRGGIGVPTGATFVFGGEPVVSEGPWGSVVEDYTEPVVERAAVEGDVIPPTRHNVWVCGVCGQENLDREARCPRCLTFR